VSEVRVYFEGSSRLRPGFTQFLRRVLARRVGIKCIPCRDRASAIRDFRKAVGLRRPGEDILLIDSEGPDNGKLFEGLKLPKANRRCVFWMVQMMESWFLADPEALARCYEKLDRRALKDHLDVETIPKRDVEAILKRATRICSQRYDRRTGAKTTMAPKILAELVPARVREKARNCDLLLSHLEKLR